MTMIMTLEYCCNEDLDWSAKVLDVYRPPSVSRPRRFCVSADLLPQAPTQLAPELVAHRMYNRRPAVPGDVATPP